MSFRGLKAHGDRHQKPDAPAHGRHINEKPSPLGSPSENSCCMSFRGAAGDEESRTALETLRARFLAEFTLSELQRFFCVQNDKRRARNDHAKRVTCRDTMVYSCNSYFMNLAVAVKPQNVESMARRCRFWLGRTPLEASEMSRPGWSPAYGPGRMAPSNWDTELRASLHVRIVGLLNLAS